MVKLACAFGDLPATVAGGQNKKLSVLLVRAPCVWSHSVFNQQATGWVTRKMASSQRQQMASVSAVEEWVGGPAPN